METTAITFWNGLVSPLFDVAETILVVKQDGGRCFVDVGRSTVHVKAARVQKHAVAALICGAISADAQAALQVRGIRVIPWMRGQVDEVLDAFAQGTLEKERFFMPGCHRRNRCGKGRPGSMNSGRGRCRRLLV